MSRKEKHQVITIDGPAASGKTSVSRELARRLGWKWLSTGAFYRGLALLALRKNVSLDDEVALAKLANEGDWEVRMDDARTRVFVESDEVTGEVFKEEAGDAASRISRYPLVRASLLEMQRDCSRRTPGLIAEGRDCGSVVFPQAPVRIYLTANQEHRAKRRASELGLSTEKTVAQQTARDQQDATRKAAPMQVPEGAFVLDTTNLQFEEVVELLEKHVAKVLPASGAKS